MGKLVNISEATSIAIHSLALIANNEQRVNATQIAQFTTFSRNHIAKILQVLTRHNYLESERGPAGGFRLNKNPQDICLLDIYELFEGKAVEHSCGIHYQKCNFSECVYGDIMPGCQTISWNILETEQ
jgi:Rrf2 family protein